MGLVTSLNSKISKAKFQALAAAQALVTVLMPTTSGGRPCFTWQLGFLTGQTGKPLDISTDWLFPKYPLDRSTLDQGDNDNPRFTSPK